VNSYWFAIDSLLIR